MEGSDSSSASVGMRGTSFDSVRIEACSTGACSEMMIGISTCRQRCGGDIAWISASSASSVFCATMRLSSLTHSSSRPITISM